MTGAVWLALALCPGSLLFRAQDPAPGPPQGEVLYRWIRPGWIDLLERQGLQVPPRRWLPGRYGQGLYFGSDPLMWRTWAARSDGGEPMLVAARLKSSARVVDLTHPGDVGNLIRWLWEKAPATLDRVSDEARIDPEGLARRLSRRPPELWPIEVPRGTFPELGYDVPLFRSFVMAIDAWCTAEGIQVVKIDRAHILVKDAAVLGPTMTRGEIVDDLISRGDPNANRMVDALRQTGIRVYEPLSGPAPQAQGDPARMNDVVKSKTAGSLLENGPVHDGEPLRPDEIHHQLLGRGNPETIVLIHGLDGAISTWSTTAETLAKKYQVLMYDQRGHGKTVDRGTDYSTTLLARDLKSLMDHYGIRNAHLLGHSLGGRVAVRFAELFPENVATVIIEDMELFQRDPSTPQVKRETLEEAEQAKQRFEGVRFATREALIDALRPFYPDAESLSYRRAARRPDGSFALLFRPYVPILFGYQANAEDLEPALRSIKKPVLFVAADPNMGGTHMSERGIEGIRAANPAAEVVMIEGAPHVLHRTHARIFLELVERFLSRGTLAEPPRVTLTERAVRRAKGELAGAGKFGAAYLVKEGANALLAGDPEHIEEAAREMATPEFLKSIAVFTVASRVTQDVLALKRVEKATPRLAKGLTKTVLPMAAGMVAMQAMSGHLDAKEAGISTGSYVGVGAGIQALTGVRQMDRVIRAACQSAGARGKIALGAYTVGQLAAMLFFGERAETFLHQQMESP